MLAGEAAAAGAEVESALTPPSDPTAAAFSSADGVRVPVEALVEAALSEPVPNVAGVLRWALARTGDDAGTALLARGLGMRLHLRHVGRVLELHGRSGTRQPRAGGLHVRVMAQGLVDQRGQSRVTQAAPPGLGLGQWLRLRIGHPITARVQRRHRGLEIALRGTTGQRRDQSPGTRSQVAALEIDTAFSTPERTLYKFNPLAQMTSEEVWGYIRMLELPYNSLHERGFISIGCEPCTRPVLPNQHEREGRWWWEE